ncbi:protein anon-37Cs isoform X1 [Nasonia vitripennis]|uniref:Amine oxidase domain-containing protein n=1 Tax=Nasonia vitripennis TaxID=7425 RepID=A0A7M7G9A2_NASVI|nr:protein anon-37Cs isoform X1 [Nasonia vitripennis]XP_032456902.1 protein anon-37Cs isoform X1 [Nasonia vitripennis]XP_032456903.1 protein anon-37Cs isoform X1 [Nasonia vitripennis]XP_032456904.1 protein anon-37Cs isoform X1 [Nasonia vitripennis]
MENYNRIQILMFTCVTILSNIRFSYCETNTTLNKNAMIIIVGAGASGIAAASKLMENGFNNIIILEAEDRIGGRVYTHKFGDYAIDIGGQWVHGIDGNIVYELAQPYNLIEISNAENADFKSEFLDSSGKKLDSDELKRIEAFIGEYVEALNCEKHPGSENFGQFIEKAFDEVLKNDEAIMQEKERFLTYFETIRIQSDAADDWHDISAPGLSEFHMYSGDEKANWKERGYSTILDILMKRFPNPENELPVLNNTILKTEVTAIDYSNKPGESSISVTSNWGHTYKADHVIVTVSLGVLKEKHKTLFTPPLPDYKINAIEATGYGTAAKIFILFDKPFWQLDDRTKLLNFLFLWKEDDKKAIETDPDKQWLLGLSDALTVEHKPNLLALWVSGKHAKQMEALPPEKVLDHSIENIKRFLGKAYNITTPKAFIRSRWHTNPHFRGIYSYRSVEAHKRQVFPEILERPLDEENLRILFAGEATSSHRYATVDGAIQSGWKAADRLIDHYEKILTVPSSTAGA